MTLHHSLTIARDWLADYAYALRCTWQGWRQPTPPAQAVGNVHVVVVPGVYERWPYMARIIEALHADGLAIHVLEELRHNTGTIPDTAALLGRYIEANDLRNVTVVAHSKGGLVGKWAMIHNDPDGRLQRVVAVATPFNGSRYARFMPTQTLRVFSPSSTVIRSLTEQTACNSRIVSIYGSFDPHIPAGSELPGATNISVDCTGHYRICENDEVVAAVRRSVIDGV